MVRRNLIMINLTNFRNPKAHHFRSRPTICIITSLKTAIVTFCDSVMICVATIWRWGDGWISYRGFCGHQLMTGVLINLELEELLPADRKPKQCYEWQNKRIKRQKNVIEQSSPCLLKDSLLRSNCCSNSLERQTDLDPNKINNMLVISIKLA